MADVTPFLIGPGATIRDAIGRIDANGRGIVLVVGPNSRLIGTVTDGDIRRAILAGLDLTLTVSTLLERKPADVQKPPLTVPRGDTLACVRQVAVERLAQLCDSDRRAQVVNVRRRNARGRCRRRRGA